MATKKSKPKKSSLKRATSNAKAASRQVKKQSSTIKANVKKSQKLATTAKKIFRDIFGRFAAPPPPKPKKKAAKKLVVKKVASKKSTTNVPPPPKPKKLATKKSISKKSISVKSTVKKAPTKKLSLKSVSEILKIRNYNTFNEFQDAVLENADRINATIDPSKGQYFGAKYFHGQTMSVYSDIRDLFAVISQYDASKAYGDDEGAMGQELIENVQVIKIKGGAIRHFKMVKDERVVREKMKDELYSEIRRSVGTKDIVTGKKKAPFELTREILEQNKAKDKQLATMQKQMDAMLKKLNQLTKKAGNNATKRNVATKSVAKTRATKTTAKKSAVKKVAKKSAKKNKGR